MNNIHSTEDVQQGFRNLDKIQLENQKSILQNNISKSSLSNYEDQEIGRAMKSMGYTERKSTSITSMLKRNFLFN